MTYSNAGFNAPARNAARGNVLEGGFGIRWTALLLSLIKGNKEINMVATKKYLTNIHLIGDEKKNAIANILGDREIDNVENA